MPIRGGTTPQAAFVQHPNPVTSPLQAELESDTYGVPRLSGSLQLPRGFSAQGHAMQLGGGLMDWKAMLRYYRALED
jgi:hypothetical protein